MKIRGVFGVLLLVSGLHAQAPEHLHWSASAQAGPHVGEALLTVDAKVDQGWHVYSQSQPAGGAVPLTLRLEDPQFSSRGPLTSSPPERHHDAAIQQDAEYFTGAFVLRLPVQRGERSPGEIPLAVHFQVCSDTACTAPRTVRLTATIGAPSTTRR